MPDNNMITVKYRKNMPCPKCRGLVMYDGITTHRIPVGFGFASSHKFQVDYVVKKGWFGQCMNCRCEIFAVTSVRRARRFPRAINRKMEVGV